MGNFFFMFYFLYTLWFTIIILLNVDGFSSCQIMYNIYRHNLQSRGYTSSVLSSQTTLVNIGSIGLNSTQIVAPDIAYFYLQNTLGLSEETMWKITLEAGSGAYIIYCAYDVSFVCGYIILITSCSLY